MIRRPQFLSLCFIVACTVMMICSCGEQQRRELRSSKADSALFAAGAVMNYDRMKHLTDSFETAGAITQLNANRWRGVYYYHQNMYRMAEICYRKALECDIKGESDQLSYNKSARRLSELLLVKGDYEGALGIAVPAIAKMEKSGVGSDLDFAILLNNIGCCQLNLGRDAEANQSFLAARDHYTNRWQSDSTSRGYQEAIVGTVYTSMAYINTRRYAESIYWIDRAEMLLDQYREKPDARRGYFDEYQGRIEIMRAVALQGLDKKKEAREAYLRFLKTAYSKTDVGRINANDYLMAADRYKEAADNYAYLDQMLAAWGKKPSLDNIQLYMLPKYRANQMAGRQDTARVVADNIFAILDKAITDQKNSAMAELATIYNTNEKEAEIARQRANMTKMLLISASAVLALILIFLVIYVFNRHRAAMRLEEAHTKLKIAYDQLEVTTKAKERIDSELRIARDIQMSMVPSVFPHHEGLDIYAAMKPAKEVGGDLYSYQLQGDNLYFCVGDVSGKGVPASLFMAQVTRLFSTLAAQHMKPAEIVSRINNALTENNEQGMFVTMFLGLLNLKTGKLQFCNAGHNPPILGTEDHRNFMEMDSNAPIGLWPELDYVGETVDNIKDKMLLIYTDGLNEAEDRQRKQFGDERLLDIMNRQHFSSACDTVKFLEREIEKHRDGAEPNDDLTMLCILT